MSDLSDVARKDAIEDKLNWIETEGINTLVVYIGNQYRKYYRTRCRCVLWPLPLPAIQAAALALGNAGLEAICRMKCLEHRSFISGAPDLLLVRGIGPEGMFDWNSICGSQMGDVEVSEEMLDDIAGLEEQISMEDELSSLSSRPRQDIFECNTSDIPIDAVLSGEWRFECKLIEVKGPTDRLSDTQQRWLYALSMNGVDNCVCRVREGGIDGIPKGFHRTASNGDDYDVL